MDMLGKSLDEIIADRSVPKSKGVQRQSEKNGGRRERDQRKGGDRNERKDVKSKGREKVGMKSSRSEPKVENIRIIKRVDDRSDRRGGREDVSS